MKVTKLIGQLVLTQSCLGDIVEKPEINALVDEAMKQIVAQPDEETSGEVATMFFTFFGSCNPELCCAFEERLKHQDHAVWTLMLENVDNMG